MKIGYFSVYTVLIFILLSGCSGNEDSFSPYYYTFGLRIEDQNGNDKVYGIGYTEESSEGVNNPENVYNIKSRIYTLEVEQTGKSKEELFLSPLKVLKDPAYKCLLITTSTLPLPDYRPGKLTHRITCPDIFGNENEYEIISYWEKDGAVANKCTHIVFNNQTYKTTDINEEYVPIPIFLITLDN